MEEDGHEPRPEQRRIPGTEQERLRVEDRRKRGRAPQRSIDSAPLFGDGHKQGDLL
jgi:hypothetical protein